MPPAPKQARPVMPDPSGGESGSSNLITDIFDEIEGMAKDARGVVRSLAGAFFKKEEKKGAAATSKPPAQVSQPAARPVAAPPPSQAATRLISQLVAPKQPGEMIGGYVIQEAWPLQHSNYYKVRMERCVQGHANPGMQVERCAECGAEFKAFLIRETDSGQRVDDKGRQTLIQLSRSGVAGMQNHVAVLDVAERRYVVSEYPGAGWSSLAQIELPVTDRSQMIQWCLGLGAALTALCEQNMVPLSSALVDYLEPIVVSNQRAFFADLTLFGPVNIAQQEEKPQQRAVAFLLQVLYMLSSGKQQNIHRAPRDFSDVPPPFRALMVRDTQSGSLNRQGFADVNVLLDALREAQKTMAQMQETPRSLRQIAGYRTDVGRKRDHNEDVVGKYSLGMQQTADSPEVGLYMVADGMGGHQAGELASREVVRVILDEIQDRIQELQAVPKLKRATIKLDHEISVGETLKQAVQKANEVLYNARKQIGSNRGTTLTSVLVVGDTSVVANVGDSRTYLWREGRLSQITQDHSLVASLVAANMIRPDEVRSHPQRNQIYRTLGERPEVEVDIFERNLRVGDRLMLCSDGLWEMVLDPEIQQIIQQATNPQEACDRLIEAANLAGGEDNISVVAVWMA